MDFFSRAPMTAETFEFDRQAFTGERGFALVWTSTADHAGLRWTRRGAARELLVGRGLTRANAAGVH